jgi:small subunit ribosomal protein S15
LTRMHRHGRGRSHSTRPVTRRPPAWCKYKSEEVEALVIKLAKEGNGPSQIGRILRDQYGIPLVKSITGKKIVEILKQTGLAPKIPEDLGNLLRKAAKLRRHVEKNRKDYRNIQALNLVESQIHRLVKYYKNEGRLPLNWDYKTELLVPA